MANKEVVNYIESVEKKRNVANEVNLGTAIFAGISAGMVATAAIMGGAAAVSTQMGVDFLTRDVKADVAFDKGVTEKRFALTDDLQAGKITIEEYNAAIDQLYSKGAVMSYAKESGTDHMKTLAASIESTDEMADTLIKKGVPRMSAVMLAPGAVAYTVSEMIRRKYDRKLKELKAQENEGM